MQGGGIILKITVAPGIEITIEDRDADILKRLAERVAEIAALPEQRQRRELWRGVNDLEKKTAIIMKHDELPWNEMKGESGLENETSGSFSQSIEQQLRRTIYQWEHMRCDMVVEPVLLSWLAIVDSGVGLEVREDLIPQGATAPSEWVHAHHYTPVIRDESDIKKIVMPQITHNEEISRTLHEARKKLVGDFLEVKECGFINPTIALWDDLVAFWGPQELLVDLIERPELVHAGVARYADVWHRRLDQYEELGLVSWDGGNYHTGAGGLGYTGDLPGKGYDPKRTKLKNIWGHCTSQIFGSVSPKMHEEFAVRYEIPIMERFGLAYYGCCEPLHDRIRMLRAIPNLRKISMSPWANLEKGVEEIGNDYVLSVKPNPAMLAAAVWEPARVRAYFEDVFEKTRGCTVEIVIKDTSTANGEPERLREMADIAMKLAERYR